MDSWGPRESGQVEPACPRFPAGPRAPRGSETVVPSLTRELVLRAVLVLSSEQVALFDWVNHLGL